MDFLNSKAKKTFFAKLKEEYGYEGSTDYAIYHGGKNKYYLISEDIAEIPYEDIRPTMAGLYIAEEVRDSIRLTMDGAMLFGPECNNCFVDVDEHLMNAWMRGEDLPIQLENTPRYTLIRWNGKILGCGHANNNEIKGYVPKGRRIHDPHFAS